MPADNSCITIAGPWKHRLVNASGAQFHLAMTGPEPDGQPIVLFVHGFPEYWYAWRHQLEALGDAGYPVAAMDVRGAGGSDRTRQTFDAPTLSRDIAGVIRALGSSSALLVGHGAGADLCWGLAATHPQLVSGLVAISSPHPADTHKFGFHVTFKTWRHVLSGMVPSLAEKYVKEEKVLRSLIEEFCADGNDGVLEALPEYVAAMNLPNAANCQIDQRRWAWRSPRNGAGRAYLEQINRPILAPVLTIRGGLDPLLPDRAWAQTRDRVQGPLQHVVLPNAGHFPHEEAADDVTRLVSDFLARVM